MNVTLEDPLSFVGRTVLVVGGTSGIGNGIACAFRDRGAAVHVWGTRPSPEDYSGEPGSDLSGMAFSRVDTTDAGALGAWEAPFDRLDVLVLSQGTVLYGREEFEPAGFAHVVDVNLKSVMFCALRFHGELTAAAGSLIVISSTAAFQATRGNPAYNASKAALTGLVRTLGEAWAPEGVRVNGIAPGVVATKLTKVTTEHPRRLESTLRGIPAGRLGTPEDIAGAALFLASPLASYVVGQTIVVDGGGMLS